MFRPNEKIGTLIAGDIVYLDPDAFPNLKIITKEEADKIAKSSPSRQFIITEIR